MSKRPTRYALGAYPIYADHGEGGHIWDVDGNEYIDWLLGQGPVMLGYRYPAVDDAIREQLSKGIVYGILDPLEVEVARLLIETVPSAERVKFLKGAGNPPPRP